MAKSVIINGATYPNVPYVNIPLAEGTGNAKFVDTDSGDAAAADIRAGKKAWVDGAEVTGSATARSASSVTAVNNTVTVPAGIYDSQVTKTIDHGSVELSASIYGTSVLGNAVSAYPVSADAEAITTGGYITEDDVEPGSNIKYIQVEQINVSPSSEAQDIAPSTGKLISGVHVNALDVSATATAAHVAAGFTFFANDLTRKTGTLVNPIITQDSTTKVLTIS